MALEACLITLGHGPPLALGPVSAPHCPLPVCLGQVQGSAGSSACSLSGTS